MPSHLRSARRSMTTSATCPSCNRGIFPDDTYCSWCGNRVQQARSGLRASSRTQASDTVRTGDRTSCNSCNGPLLPGDAFCSSCGAQVGATGVALGGESWTRIAREITGATRGKYEVVRELGRGGMGLVFLARDRELHRRVAIKVLAPTLLSDDAMVQRFLREARIIASLRHESIVAIYDVGQAGDLRYFVMDYIDGVSLSQVLRRRGPLPIPLVQAIFYQVGQALAYVHRSSRGLVHRDVKPSNVMLDPEGIAVLMDFGISKLDESGAGITRTGLVMGTPEYMSPEQCRGLAATAESDQYALGAVAYAMLTGRPPFTGPFYQVLVAHQGEPVQPILEVRPDCPPEFASGVERMLSKLPGDRWTTISEGLRAMGLRPLLPDDPLRGEIARLVAEGMGAADREPPGTSTHGTGTPPTRIRIEPLPEPLQPGDLQALRATILFETGDPAPSAPLAWHSTDPSVVRVDPETGEMEAVGVGQATIFAMGGGLAESLAVEVRPPSVHSVAVFPDLATLETGERMVFRGIARSARGEVLERGVEWSSTAPQIIEVAGDGRAQAKEPGTAQVVARSEGTEGVALVRVEAVKPEPAPARAPARAPAAPRTTPSRSPKPSLATPSASAQGRRRSVAGVMALLVAVAVGTGWWLSGREGGEAETGTAVAGAGTSLDAGAGSPPTPLGAEEDAPVMEAERVESSASPPSEEGAGGPGLPSPGPLPPASPAVTPSRATGSSTGPGSTAPEVSPPAPAARTQPSEPEPVVIPPEPAAPPVQATGRLQILVRPWAHVFVNDIDRGQFQSDVLLELPSGSHQVRLVNPNRQSLDTTVVVEAGETTVVSRALGPRSDP